MTTSTPTIRGEVLQAEPLPSPAHKLVLRVLKELNKRGKVEILVIDSPDGSWLVFVNDGKREVLK